jgi:ligand-binding sensor domain-containing protein
MPDSKDPSSISGLTIYNLKIDHNNILWLSIYNQGIDLFDINKGVVQRFRPNADQPGSISGINCWFYFEDSEKNMWICTQNGLSLFDRLKNSFKCRGVL